MRPSRLRRVRWIEADETTAVAIVLASGAAAAVAAQWKMVDMKRGSDLLRCGNFNLTRVVLGPDCYIVACMHKKT